VTHVCNSNDSVGRDWNDHGLSETSIGKKQNKTKNNLGMVVHACHPSYSGILS
jgi:hypothetical protein